LSPAEAAGGGAAQSGGSALPAAQLVTRCDPAAFGFDTTADLPDGDTPFGQARAVDALHLALAVRGPGYHLFVAGEPAMDHHGFVRRLLQRHAATQPAPPDWCYLYNFTDANRPRVLSLPPGQGHRLRQAMQRFVAELSKAASSALESDVYRSRLDAIQKEAKEREEGALQALGESAVAQGVALIRTPQGFAFAPMDKGKPLPAERFEQLGTQERERLAGVIGTLSERLKQVLHELPRQRREMQQRIREATRDAMAMAAGHLVDELKAEFDQHPQVKEFLDDVRRDIIESGEQLREQAGTEEEEDGALAGSLALHRYQVNLLVGEASGQAPTGGEADGEAGEEASGTQTEPTAPPCGAPVLLDDHPTYANLVGRIDHVAHMGTLLTNFTLIRAGSLHRANGGVLMLDAAKVLSEPLSWAGLKRALKSARVVIESMPQALGWVNTLPLEPEPVPLNLKIVLFGDRQLHHLLQALDPEFDDLFKVVADFEEEVPRQAESCEALARWLGFTAREQGLRPLTRDAVACLVDHAARLAEDGARLSTHTRTLGDLLHEADAQAAREGRAVIDRADVTAAQAARVRRTDRLRDSVHDELLRGTLLVSTEGEHIGQVNGLVVAQWGEFRFAYPVRITATTRLGDGELVDIERESTLGGPLHAKGVMILAAFLGARYAQELPLSLAASLVFEQSYGPVEGDSASLAELCALLSALALVPVQQGLAVTGSINQFGRVQAIGGVNEKIEGFFDLCRQRGLDGHQGVLIPRANVQHLMLRDDVVQAVAQGRFNVHAVDDVDQAIERLTGVPAGAPNAKGEVPPGTVNHLVASRLAEFSMLRQAWSSAAQGRAASRPAGHAQRIRHRPRRPTREA
jgi:predicted ATP-dependent protease